MVLLYTSRTNNRVHYIVKTILGDYCGFDHKITQSVDEFLNFKGAKINYSDKVFPDSLLTINPSGFLFGKGIKEFTPAIERKEQIPYLFAQKSNGAKCDFGYDPFSAAFYMLSRYEEYLPYMEDRHGRFEADQCLAYHAGFIELPVVDIYALQLKKRLTDLFPMLEYKEKTFKFIPTYDIDVAYAYRGKGLARNTLLFVFLTFTLKFKMIYERIKVLSKQTRDPFDTYQQQFQLQKQYRLNPIYFFLSGQFGPKDRNISIHSRTFQALVKNIGDYATAGIHPSYASNYSLKKLKEEINYLSGILNSTIENSRQHYLKMKLPETYQNLIKFEIKNDYSMGFASHTGFRAGTCTPFIFYDLSQELETNLKVYPLAIMDGSLRDYMKLNPEKALVKAKEIIDTIRKVNGTLVTLWHNDALSDQGDWNGWSEVYYQIVEYATNNFLTAEKSLSSNIIEPER
jgi:hypothetical protein